MTQPKQLLPRPAERPDLYGYDRGPSEQKMSKAYYEAVMPEHVKTALAARGVKLFDE
jgi:hypothetical protein